jgi:hypothetical protein
MGIYEMLFLGPLSGASPGGGDPSTTWFSIAVASAVLVTAWIKYLNRDDQVKAPIVNLVWVSGVCAIIIVLSILGLLHK